jgi:hypothetical protein
MNEKLTVPLDGIKYVLKQLSVIRKQPELKDHNPADFVDSSFTEKLEAEGFFKRLNKNK